MIRLKQAKRFFIKSEIKTITDCIGRPVQQMEFVRFKKWKKKSPDYQDVLKVSTIMQRWSELRCKENGVLWIG